MTYCVAIQVNQGLVFAADTRTSAGVDDVRTYNKLHVFEFAAQRVFVLLCAGSLATTQAVLAQLRRDLEEALRGNLRRVRRLCDAAEYVGAVLAQAQRDAVARMPPGADIDLRATLILGGQIDGEAPALYLIYPEGNCISSSPETPYLQIGESKYGKPILDRVVHPGLALDDAARCALVSLDSTMKSNISVGPPLDLAMLPRDALRIAHRLRLHRDTPLLAELREAWGRQLLRAFRKLPRFDWEQSASRGRGAASGRRR